MCDVFDGGELMTGGKRVKMRYSCVHLLTPSAVKRTVMEEMVGKMLTLVDMLTSRKNVG